MNLQSQVTNLQSRQASLNSTIEVLTQADTTILELLKFIDTNQSDRINIVSIDTSDMLLDSVSVDSSGVAVTQPTTTDPSSTGVDQSVSGSAGGSTSSRQPIIVRGYARTGTEAVNYYDRLFKYGLPVDPVLNGVERYTLPNGEEVYVFEIEIGGDNT